MTGAGMFTGADLREALRAFLAAGFLAAFFAARFLVAFLAPALRTVFLAADLRAVFLAAPLRAVFFAAFFAVLRTAFFAAFFAVLRTAFLAVLRTAFFAVFFAVLRTAFFAVFFAAFLAPALRTVFLAADLRAVFFVAFLADFFAAFFMAMGWLLVSGLAWLELPSSKRRRGSRTRGQPPTRQARRDGFGAPRRQGRGNKKPATPSVAGLMDLVPVRFREGNGACIHRVLCPGGGPFRGARC